MTCKKIGILMILIGASNFLWATTTPPTIHDSKHQQCTDAGNSHYTTAKERDEKIRKSLPPAILEIIQKQYSKYQIAGTCSGDFKDKNKKDYVFALFQRPRDGRYVLLSQNTLGTYQNLEILRVDYTNPSLNGFMISCQSGEDTKKEWSATTRIQNFGTGLQELATPDFSLDSFCLTPFTTRVNGESYDEVCYGWSQPKKSIIPIYAERYDED